ncbi:MAG: hypothetical protein WA152_03185 [Microgenomates group bacterium]
MSCEQDPESLFKAAVELVHVETAAEKTNCESDIGRSQLDGISNNPNLKCLVAGISVPVINGKCQANSTQCKFAL